MPRSVGGAVERNKIKRQLREVWSGRLERVPGGNDYVLIVRPGLPDAVTANGFDWLGERVGRGPRDDEAGSLMYRLGVAFRLALSRHVRGALPDNVQVPPVLFAVRDRRGAAEGARARVAPRGWRLLRCNPWSHGGFDPVR